MTRGFKRVDAETTQRLRREGLLYRSAKPTPDERRRIDDLIATALFLATLVGASAARRWITASGAGFGVIPKNIADAQQKLIEDPITSSVAISAEAGAQMAAREVSGQIVARGDRITYGFSEAQWSESIRLVTNGHRGHADRIVEDLMRRIRAHGRIAELAVKQATYIAYNDAIAEIASTPAGVAKFPLWYIDEQMDDVTRGNPVGKYPEPHRHWQFSGYVNTIAEIIRFRVVPPNGFNCRAALRPMTVEDANNRNLLDAKGRVIIEAVRAMNGERQDLIDDGLYPDNGWVRAE